MTTLSAQSLVTPRQPPAAQAAAPATLRIQLLGLPLDAVTESHAVSHIIEKIERKQGGWVITPNLDHLRRFTSDPEFAAYFSQADLVLCDGMPLVWASKLQGTPVPQRVAGSDLIWSLSAAADDRGIPIYLLGGDPGIAAAAAESSSKSSPR